MMVMCANNSGSMFRSLLAAHPEQLGWLLSPNGYHKPICPFAVDNGAFPAWTKGQPWDETAFYRHLEKCDGALWVVVPDVVADRDATLRMWDKHVPRLSGFPLAFACQDGMTPADVPSEASVIFIGGSTRWKWRSLPMWAEMGKPMHVARVNTHRLLCIAERMGAVSCDGTGWFRGCQRQLRGLVQFLEGTRHEDMPELSFS